MKRFTQTEKWRDLWYRKLKPEIKCLWEYCLDNSDGAAVLEIDREAAIFSIGGNIDWNKVEELFKDRMLSFKGKNGAEKKWFPAKIFFQNGHLNPASPPHKAVINLLKQYGLWERYNTYLAESMPDFITTPDQDELIPPEKPPKEPQTTEEKKCYGELQKVKLSDDEYRKLQAKHDQAELDAGIEILDGYIASKNKRYANHYAVLKTDSWVWERVKALPLKETAFDSVMNDYVKQAVTMVKSGQQLRQFYHGVADKIGGVKLKKIQREVDRILNNEKQDES